MKLTLSKSILILLMVSQFGCSPRQSPENQEPTIVYLLRHAEKVDHSKDPELSDAGKKRALELVKTLRSVSIDYIHSSDYIRTRNTAKPIAEKFGLTTEIYNPNKLEALALKIKSKGGSHLVVGHSGSTPEMVEILGGNPISEINDASEYDRLYIVHISDGSSTSSILIRYGLPYLEALK